VSLSASQLARPRLFWAVALATLLFSSLPLTERPLWAHPALQSNQTGTQRGVIVADVRVNLREGPGATYAILAKLDVGTEVTVVDQTDNGNWLQVRVDGSGRTGWVSANLVRLQTTNQRILLPTPTPDRFQSNAGEASTTVLLPTPTPVPAAAVEDTEMTFAPAEIATSVPVAVVRPANMNVRGGPGTNYSVVATVRQGTTLPILALGPNRDWYKVQFDGVEEAWLAANLVNTNGVLDSLEIIAAEQLPAPPVAAPTPAAEPAAAASTTAAPAEVASAPPPAGGGFFAYGIQAHLWQNSEKGFVAGQIRDIGFTWVKSQLRWEFVENSPGAIDWSEPDRIIDTMHGNGINVLFSIFTAPQWTRPDKPGTGGPPNDFNLYADFVGKVAQRYCGRLGAIEVWNEQNLQREWEGFPLDPALYMDLLRRAYTSIKANCPSVLVISGAPTPAGHSPVAVDDVDYLRGMYANGLAQYSDGVGVHPSGFANPPEVTVQDWQAGRYTPPPSHFDHRSFYFRSTMEEYRAVMVAYGDANKRLWPTEFGWGSTSTPFPGYEYEAYITESTQAQYIVRAYLLMREWGWVGVPFLWNLNFNEGEMAAFSVAGRPAVEALKTLPK
jgi:uncharacterized protein YgiM (DUF1202 family)